MLDQGPLRTVIAGWQSRLLDLGQRNKLLYFNPESRSVVRISAVDIGGFLERLGSARRGLSFAFEPAAPRSPQAWFATAAPSGPPTAAPQEPRGQPGDIETPVPVRQLQTRLLRLRNLDREFTEEQGISVLFLACGFLQWVDEQDIRAMAPLILVPCTLQRASPRDPFILTRSEDEVLSNLTLEHKLSVDFHLSLPEFSPDTPPEVYFDSVAEAIAGKAGWRVARDVFLGTFQYSKMAMWEDLEALRTAAEIRHPLVRFLAGDPGGATGTADYSPTSWFGRREEELAGGVLDDHVDPQAVPLVMPADFSQLQCIGKARTGQHLVIHGPPGTGKSQTIGNLIGAYVADGESVLFVSEKTAALDVVKRRLTDCGLGVFCLDLHSERGKKVNVYAQFREALDAEPVSARGFDHRRLLDLRRQLNEYVRELHRRREPLGLSVFQVNGRFAKVRNLPDADFAVPDVKALTVDFLAMLEDQTRRLAARPREFVEHFTSRWRILRDAPPSLSLPTDIRRRVQAIANSIGDLDGEAQRAANWLGVPPPSNSQTAGVLSEILDHFGSCPGIEAHWLSGNNVNELMQTAEEERMRQETRRDLVARFLKLFRLEPSGIADFSSLVDAADGVRVKEEVVARWLGRSWAQRLLIDLDEFAATLGYVIEFMRRIGSTSAPGSTGQDSQRALIDVVRGLFPAFDPDLLQAVSREMLLRFRLDYGNGLKRFVSGHYRRDVRLIRSFRAARTRVLYREACEVVEAVNELQSQRHILEGSADLLPVVERLRSVLETLAPIFESRSSDWEQLKACIEYGKAVLQMDDDMARRAGALKASFGRRFAGWETDWSSVTAALEWTSRLRSLIPENTMSALLVDHATSPRPEAEYRDRGVRLAERLQSLLSSCGHLEPLVLTERLPWSSWDSAPFRDLEQWTGDLHGDADAAYDWLVYREIVLAFDAQMGAGTVDRTRRVTDSPQDVPGVVQRRLFEAWLDDISQEVPVLRRFAGIDHNALIAEFKALDRALPVAARAEVRRRVFASYPRQAALTNAGELPVLRSEVRKRRRQLPVRRLLQRIPALARQLKPCFMMSPLAVSQFLPRTLDGDLFDVVIFDEASQVFPEDAVPAICRARQAIIVGDDRQLPPTSFFRRLGDGSDDSVEELEEYQDVDALEGKDSILDAMLGKALGTVAGEGHLNVHYRSKHEDLIRFSNASFYDNRLHVYPSAVRKEEGLGLHDVFVPDATYENRRNLLEAQRVVDLVFDLMRTRPSDESIGVVALSLVQAELIQELMNNRRLSETDVESRFEEGGAEPFFIKNLERVQGDERDHVILCIGYGRSPTARATDPIHQRFGPLNSDLGWRRLNVAITRARQSLRVVHCLRPEQVTGTQRGARELRSFLEFVRDPQTWSATRSVSMASAEGDPDSDFEAAVYAALKQRGHDVRAQVGAAGYRVDLAILSSDGMRYDLGIECDGAMYHSGPAARDRDWLRQSILEELGWCIHRVWSTDWIRNAGREVEAIEEALAHCRARQSAYGSAPSGLPSDAEDPPREEGERSAPSPAVEEDARPLFPEYEFAEFSGLRHGPELRYEAEETLGQLLLRIAAVEGPVHFDEAITALREVYGMGRAGKPTREHVVNVIGRLATRGKLRLAGPFFGLPDEAARPRRPGASYCRPIDHVSPAELAEGLFQVSSTIHGATRDELINETARQFGYERTGRNIEPALRGALDSLMKQGRITVDDQRLLRVSRDESSLNAKGNARGSRGASRLEQARAVAMQSGLEIIDMSASGGRLWIVGGRELGHVLSPLGLKFAPGGGRATRKRAAWFAP